MPSSKKKDNAQKASAKINCKKSDAVKLACLSAVTLFSFSQLSLWKEYRKDFFLIFSLKKKCPSPYTDFKE